MDERLEYYRGVENLKFSTQFQISNLHFDGGYVYIKQAHTKSPNIFGIFFWRVGYPNTSGSLICSVVLGFPNKGYPNRNTLIELP